MSDLNKKFLIRSSGQVLGPFSKVEVIDYIKQGRISSFDEVAEPYSIWFYLEDHLEFKSIIHSMDFTSRLTNFVTKITHSISSNSQARTKSEVSQDAANKQTLPGSTSPDLVSSEKQVAKEVQIEVLKQPQEQTNSYARYQSQKDREEFVRKKINKIIRIIWTLIVIFSLSVGSYIIYKEFVRPFQNKQKIAGQFNTEGLKFYKAGNYKEALAYFEMAYSQNILQGSDLLVLGSLYFQENKLQKTSLILDEFVNLSLTKTKPWFVLNGLLAFSQNNFFQADQFFNQVTEKDVDTLLNLSLLKWRQKNFKSSLSYLNEAKKRGYERGLVFYLKALNLFSQNQFVELIAYIDEELMLNSASPLTQEFHQELYFMLVYSHFHQGNRDQFEKSLQNLFNQDPFFYKDYKYSSFIAIRELKWSYFYPYCKRLFDSDSNSSLLNALYSFCYLKTSRLKESSQFINKAKSKEPNNPLFLSLYAYLLMLKGEEDLKVEQTLSLISMDTNQQKQLLPYIIQARFLEQKSDWGRALKAWTSLLSLSPKHLSGLAGVALSSYKLGDYSKADIYKQRTLDKYPYFIRLLSY